MSDSEDKYVGSTINLVHLLITLTIFWICSLAFLLIFRLKIEDLASLGDSFATFGTLFSALALGGVIFAIILQQKEMKKTQEIFLNQQKEMKKSADTQEVQTKLNALLSLIKFCEEGLKKSQKHFNEALEEEEDTDKDNISFWKDAEQSYSFSKLYYNRKVHLLLNDLDYMSYPDLNALKELSEMHDVNIVSLIGWTEDNNLEDYIYSNSNLAPSDLTNNEEETPTPSPDTEDKPAEGK